MTAVRCSDALTRIDFVLGHERFGGRFAGCLREPGRLLALLLPCSALLDGLLALQLLERLTRLLLGHSVPHFLRKRDPRLDPGFGRVLVEPWHSPPARGGGRQCAPGRGRTETIRSVPDHRGASESGSASSARRCSPAARARCRAEP